MVTSDFTPEVKIRLFRAVSTSPTTSPVAVAYSMGQIIKSVCVSWSVCQCICVSVCEHSHGRISWPKRKRECFNGGGIHFDVVASRLHLYYRLATFSVPRTVAELDMSHNPIISPQVDARASLFVRMYSDEGYARHITSLNLTATGLHVIPDAVPACRRLVSLQLAYNRITVFFSFSCKCASHLAAVRTRRNWSARTIRCSAIAERPRCRVRYSFRQK